MEGRKQARTQGARKEGYQGGEGIKEGRKGGRIEG
jgi:hypothetical protein